MEIGNAKGMIVRELCDNRLNSPISIMREIILKVEIGREKIPSLKIATWLLTVNIYILVWQIVIIHLICKLHFIILNGFKFFLK